MPKAWGKNHPTINFSSLAPQVCQKIKMNRRFCNACNIFYKYRPTPDIDSEILKSMKIVGTIGYARNTNNAKRNVVKYSNLKTKQSDSTNSYRNNVGEEQESSHQGTGALSPAMNIVPKYYRYVIVYVFTTVTKI